jgi:methyltransferase-like protein/2-polyprenyl-3-methyl-5-hydroxy-6-metoxy-1,4-benzoquinol methylase
MTSIDPSAESAKTAASYEALPYDVAPLFETHPEALAVAAMLLGMDPPSPNRCRVLELGCATGHNLIPMAEELPGSTFVGIDISPRQISMGRETVAAIGLTNIELRALDIAAIDDSLGQFDYIICHGVYSWVPRALQEKILGICSRQLAPQGVMYLTYNTFPGWHARLAAREAMWYRSRRTADAQASIQQARSFLDLLAKLTSETKNAYHQSVDELATWMRTQQDYYVFHEYLEVCNQPVYFYEFVERLRSFGLRHLGEPSFARGTDVLSTEARAALLQLTVDSVELEQYADFVLNRSFRRSLVGRAEAGLAEPQSRFIEKMHVRTMSRPVSPSVDVTSSSSESFRDKDDTNLSTADPLFKAALVALYEVWPVVLSFDELCQTVERKLAAVRGPLDAVARQQLAGHMLTCYRADFVSLHTGPPEFLTRVSERPRASRLAQYQALKSAEVVNLRHRNVTLPDFPRLVLLQLDGRVDESGVVELILQAMTDGRLPLDPQLTDLAPDARRQALRGKVHGSFDYLMRAALLK